MDVMTKTYLDNIDAAKTLDELDRITEDAANNDELSALDYGTIYNAGLRKAQEWRGF